MLNKLFGFGKKKGEYFLEFKKPEEGETKVATVAAEKKENTAAAASEKPADSATVVTAPVTPVPANIEVSYEPPEWVKAIKNYSTPSDKNKEESLFAGKYISNSIPLSRRRPGPSLAPFKNMASQLGKK
ncbi:MAG: hypothetical protein NZ901_03525 [Geminocystis sp.]|nr:hypothetical protein [Geminocystis sp.]MCS7147241.1 hypothetical protein [Geminocystis sp.]MDW8116237.1 hypothetical protein [Geminocystis sp.]MDW8462771.1 hypothetical protein [Geminocystis sp.]